MNLPATDNRHLNPNTAPLVRIDWEDICTSDSWNDGDGDTLQPLESTTTGYLLLDTPTMIVVADSYNWRDQTWATIHTFSKMPPSVTVLVGGGDE